ncbi:MAG: type III-A CRISPR-associated protein Csm2 [Eubacteriales bacterium]|nr:type III-A CRISPR-associated protein Csm2 [Eubacteriales bacterium]
MYGNNGYGNGRGNFNSRGSYGNNRGSYGNDRGSHGGQRRDEVPAIPKPMKLPTDYVKAAEDAMKSIRQEEKKENKITTSKLRNLYSLTMCIYDKELRRTDPKLLPEDDAKLTQLHMRLLYEYGRDNGVKVFADRTKVLSYLKGIQASREEYLNFAHYMEALVAYHRFLGMGGNN